MNLGKKNQQNTVKVNNETVTSNVIKLTIKFIGKKFRQNAPRIPTFFGVSYFQSITRI